VNCRYLDGFKEYLREHLTNEEVRRRAGVESIVKKVKVRIR
jgi:hypothetical protein